MEDQAATPEVKKVTNEERLEAENLHYRLLTALQKEQLLQMQMLDIQRQKLEAHQALLIYKGRLSAKYGVDLQTHELKIETGEIVLRGGATVPFANIAQQMTDSGS